MYKKSYLPYGKDNSGSVHGFDWLNVLIIATIIMEGDILSVDSLSWDVEPDFFVVLYQWQYSIDGEEYSNIEGADQGVLELTQYSPSGYYRCSLIVGGPFVYTKTVCSNSVIYEAKAVYGIAIYGVSKYSANDGGFVPY